jgi:tape measure domain-containing protein
MAAVEKIKISLEFSDSGASAVVKKLESSFRGLTSAANQLDSQGIGKVATRIKSFDNVGRRNIETIKAQINAMQGLRSQAQIGSRQFRTLTNDINRYSDELAKAESRSRKGRGFGGRLKTAGGVAATALGAGVFGGPEGFAGSLIGGAVGGIPGSILGATVGAAVGNLRKQAAAVAETVATFNKYQIALAGVSTDQEDFNTSINAAKKFSEQFVVPLDTTIAQYTKLKASVVGAGLGTEETNKAFEALSASVLATGGSSEDLNSALRAASQVFSKGKVSAEELRQQIGERLPGAFTIFADSMGISTKQLDKLLEGGKVTLDDFVGFTEELIRRYGTTAEVLAQAPELAGQRLEVAVKKAQLAFGGFFANVGAGFQDYGTNLINFALNNEQSIKENIAKFIVFGEDMIKIFQDIGKVIVQSMGPVFKFIGEQLEQFARMAGALAEDVGRATLEERYVQTYGKESYEALKTSANQKARERLFKMPEHLSSMQFMADAVTAGDLQTTSREIRDEMMRSALPSFGQELSYADKVANALAGLEFTPTNFGSGLRSGDLGGSGVDPSGATSGSKRAPASQRMVDLTEQLAQRTGELGERELITLKYMIARQKVLDNNLLPATDKEVGLNKALEQFRGRILALDEKEASARDRALAKVTKFEQLEANLLAKKMGLTGEQTKQQLLQANINTLTDQYAEAMRRAGIPADEIKRRIQEAAQAMVDLKDKGKSFKEIFADGIKGFGDLTGNLANLTVNAFTRMSDVLTEFVTTGKANFADFAASVLRDLAQIFVRFALFQAIAGIFPGMGKFLGIAGKGAVIGGKGGPPTTMPDSVSLVAANGMAFSKNKIVPFAKGGIVKKPTFFQYASGGYGNFGLMGEAGPEAIMPLRRGANGKLGVEASGSGVGNVVVNVDAKGTTAQGDGPSANQLGKVIGAAVQAELVKQQRPGGLLSR